MMDSRGLSSSWHQKLITMSSGIVLRIRNRWIYWNQSFLGLVMAYLVRHNINKKSWNIMIKLGGHVLRSPGRSTLSLWSWSRCQMKNTLEIFIISKDRVLSLINCPLTSRRIFQTLRMWFSGSNFGRNLPYKYSSEREKGRSGLRNTVMVANF